MKFFAVNLVLDEQLFLHLITAASSEPKPSNPDGTNPKDDTSLLLQMYSTMDEHVVYAFLFLPRTNLF